MYRNYTNVSELMGKTLNRIDNKADNELVFYTTSGEVYKMYHEQDCCEIVTLEDIVGDLDDLIGSPIEMAEEVSNEFEDNWGSETWTYYKFATDRGYVTLRWFGRSNGCYSEKAAFALLEEDELP